MTGRTTGATAGFAGALLVLAFTAGPAASQDPGQQMVPLELAQTLFAMGGDSLPEVLVGRLPDPLAGLLPLPSGARVIGGLIHPDRTLSAVAFPGAPVAVREDVRERLLAAGWSPNERPPRGGFEGPEGGGLQFCMGDTASFSLRVIANPRGGSYVRALWPTGRYPGCREADRYRPWTRESLIPSLPAPNGSTMRGGAGGGGGDEWHSSARLRTDLTVEQLLDHYGARLREHDWRPAARAVARGIIGVETYRVTDAEGDEWHGVLTAATPSTGRLRFLSVRVSRVESGS